jgi:hypothetical protein
MSGKNLMARALTNFDLSVLEKINDIDLKMSYFSNCITTLLNIFLPHYKLFNAGNRWIKDKFHRLTSSMLD